MPHCSTRKHEREIHRRKREIHQREREMVRQKNPHPKRAENARTVVVASDREEREERVLCLRIPDCDDDEDDEMKETNRYEKKR